MDRTLQLLFFGIGALLLTFWHVPLYSQTFTTPELQTPTPGGTFLGNSATFEWTGHNTPVTAWRLEIGTTFMGSDIYNSGDLPGIVTAKTVTTLPTNLPPASDTVHVSLHYQSNSLWQYINYAYTAINLPHTSCVDWDFFTVDGKLLFNSPWGQYYLPSGGWSQCITLALSADGQLLPSWDYDWLNKEDSTNPYAVKAFPEMIFGNKSGDKISGTQEFTGFPVRLKDMPDFTINLRYKESGGPTLSPPTTARNVSIDSFFHGQSDDDGTTECSILGAGNPQGLPGNRRFEIMVWTETPDASTFVKPGGPNDQVFKTDGNGNTLPIIIDNREYEVWVHKSQDPAYIAFLAIDSHSDENHIGEATIKWSRFVQWVRDNQQLHGNVKLNENWCMGGFEFGTEIWWGKGNLEVLQFDVTATDETNPEVVFTKPAGNSQVLPPAPVLGGQITDRGGSGIEALRIAIKNQTTGEWLNQTTGQFQANFSYKLASLSNNTLSQTDWEIPTALSDGSYKLLALPFDKAGNYPTADNGTKKYFTQRFMVNSDVSAPSTSISSTGIDEFSFDRQFSGAANDTNSTIASVRLALKNLSTGEWYNFANGLFNTTFAFGYANLNQANAASINWDFQALLNAGDYKLFAAAIDSVGNYERAENGTRSYATKRFSIQEDNSPPQTNIDLPTDNSTILAGSTTLNGFATDNMGSGIDHVRIALRNTITGEWLDFNGNSFAAGFSHTQASITETSPDNIQWTQAINLAVGQYKLFALATDKQGNYETTPNGDRAYTAHRFTVTNN